MAMLKCKMCGGTLEVNESEKLATCEFCGTQQTIPTIKDEIETNLFNRANNLRIKGEFDKAQEIYEKMINDGSKDSESFWGVVLCKYGIEYVEDPKTHERIPTCHRAQFESVVTDTDYLSAIEYADAVQKSIYEKEANRIDKIQKSILNISQKEKPFDVFICYKETDKDGKRTQDSVIANDIYHQLTNEGLRVFYAAITLEDKLGAEYEPYIFAALNSAKVMLVIGTKPEYFEAVWVKNEWSRYLKIVSKSNGKKLIIPCYKDMDAYDLPEEFSHLQAQNMSKIGFIQDIIRGINKITDNNQQQEIVRETVSSDSANGNISALLKRGFMALEDEEWTKADEFFEQVLNFDAEIAEAYLGKLMAELKIRIRESLKNISEPFDSNNNYKKVIRFGDEQLKTELVGYINFIKERNEIERKEGIYQRAISKMNEATVESYVEAINAFNEIAEYKNSKEMCEKAEIARKDTIYEKAVNKMENAVTKEDFEVAVNIFSDIADYKDVNEKIMACRERYEIVPTAYNLKRAMQKALIKKYTDRAIDWCVSAGGRHTVGLKSDGTVVAVGANHYKQCRVDNWKDIVAISAGYLHTVGLKLDTTMVAIGYNFYGQCNVSSWKDIVAVSTGDYHTVGLKADGTVVAVGYNFYGQCDVSGWKDIVAVSTGNNHTVGLKADGTVVAVGYNFYGQCDISGWKDIVAVSAGGRHTVGLKSDGTVAIAGSKRDKLYRVRNWKDIVAISAGDYHTVGLKIDGTVVAVGNNDFDQCKVSEWKSIAAISADNCYTVGLKSDGTVVAVGNNEEGQCNVYSWKDIVCPTEAIKHRKEILAKKQPELNRQRKEYRDMGVCQYCGGEFAGFFKKKCTKCGIVKDY